MKTLHKNICGFTIIIILSGCNGMSVDDQIKLIGAHTDSQERLIKAENNGKAKSKPVDQMVDIDCPTGCKVKFPLLAMMAQHGEKKTTTRSNISIQQPTNGWDFGKTAVGAGLQLAPLWFMNDVTKTGYKTIENVAVGGMSLTGSVIDFFSKQPVTMPTQPTQPSGDVDNSYVINNNQVDSSGSGNTTSAIDSSGSGNVDEELTYTAGADLVLGDKVVETSTVDGSYNPVSTVTGTDKNCAIDAAGTLVCI